MKHFSKSIPFLFLLLLLLNTQTVSNPLHAQDDDLEQFEENDDDETLPPDISEYDRPDWIRLHLHNKNRNKIQGAIACMEAAWSNSPEWVADLEKAVVNGQSYEVITNMALHALSRMDRDVLLKGRGLKLIDSLLKRYTDLIKKNPYGQKQLITIFKKFNSKIDIRYSTLNNFWKKKEHRQRLQKYINTLKNKPQANPTAPSSSNGSAPENPFEKINYYGKFPIDLILFIEVAPKHPSSSDWDTHINTQSEMLLGLLDYILPEFRARLITFADKKEGATPMTPRIDDLRDRILELRFAVKKATRCGVGFLHALDWCCRQTAWAPGSKRIAIIIADQAEQGETVLKKTNDLLRKNKFERVHVAGHYPVKLKVDDAPAHFRAIAKANNGRQTHARYLSELAKDIAPLAFSTDKKALAEMKTIIDELRKFVFQHKISYPKQH